MSSSVIEKWGKKTPWVMGKSVRIPRVKFPDFTEGNLALPTPGRSILLLVIYGFLFWLVAGGIYILIRNPIALGADQSGNPLWLYPSANDAFIIESIVAAAIIFLGGLGFIMLYEATKHSFNYSYAIKLIIFGLIACGLSFGLLQYMMKEKTGS
jgi:hypothetical protein